ncbi:MAG: RIP metalloprotease RseP [Steroidobacteraceae bacterium]
MMLMWYALWYIVAVGFLVIVHEFGHFWVARRLGFKVLRFSIGFGKPLLRKVVGADRTEFVLAPIPMGGYVKMLDEREGPVAPEDLARSFTRRPPWQRILVLFAGPGANVVFAVLVLWGMFWVNGSTDYRPIVGDVAMSSPAARAGLRSGDDITAINGQSVADQGDVVFGLLDSILARGSAELSVQHGNSAARAVTLAITDTAERKKLSDLSNLLDVIGFQFEEPRTPPVLSAVQKDSPAAKAGLHAGDRILAVDGKPVSDFTGIRDEIAKTSSQTLEVRYSRAGVDHSVQVGFSKDGPDGQKIIGVMFVDAVYPPGMVVHTNLSPAAALGAAAGEAWDVTALQSQLMWRMVLGQVSLKNLSGPIGIAEVAGESASAGAASFVRFLVLISLIIAFVNLLPIPLLDGGQIVFQVAEWVKGSPLSERTLAFGQQVGLALIVLLLGVAIFNDVTRQLG